MQMHVPAELDLKCICALSHSGLCEKMTQVNVSMTATCSSTAELQAENAALRLENAELRKRLAQADAVAGGRNVVKIGREHDSGLERVLTHAAAVHASWGKRRMHALRMMCRLCKS